MAQLALDYCVQIIETAAPVALVFGFTNIIVSFFMRVAFGGAMRFHD